MLHLISQKKEELKKTHVEHTDLGNRLFKLQTKKAQLKEKLDQMKAKHDELNNHILHWRSQKEPVERALNERLATVDQNYPLSVTQDDSNHPLIVADQQMGCLNVEKDEVIRRNNLEEEGKNKLLE